MTNLLARLESAGEGSRELDVEIAAIVFPKMKQHADNNYYIDDIRVQIEHFTTNLQDALGLYDVMPEMVYSDPLKVCVDALGRLTDG